MLLDRGKQNKGAGLARNGESNRYRGQVKTKSGRRPDLNDQYFRSAWEANIARFFNFTMTKWQYEPKTFYFEGIKRGCVSYTPDFYLPEEDKWVEVKGWMDKKSQTKLKRFAKYYPDEYAKLQIYDSSAYKEIEQKLGRLIGGWE